MKKTIFKGSAVAIVTPFGFDGTINYNVFGDLIEEQIKNSTNAIVVCGTTGEASTLSDEEHRAIIEFAVKKISKRVPVIAGTGSNDTAYALDLSLFAKEAGVDAHLQVTPYYNKTTQKGIVKHFTYIADRVDLPMIVYNVPPRTGLDIKPETYKELSKHPNIVATKEANGNIPALIKTINLCEENLHVYSGDDTLIVPMLSVGALGVISVLANIKPKQTHDICSLYFEGETKKSARMQIELINLIDALFAETNPIPIKAAMRLMGWDVGECRLPLCELENKNLELLKSLLLK